MSSSIKTFAFFDLETTGIPSWGNPARITEISIIAIPIYNLMNDDFSKDNIRVQHKLNLCINPMKMIDPDSTNITRLTNEMLEHESKFSVSTLKLLQEFFEHLQKPICLVAHNGNKFDFKILKQYYEKLKFPVSDDLMCCDSLLVFKEIFDKKGCTSSSIIVQNELLTTKNSEFSSDEKFYVLVNDELSRIEEMERKADGQFTLEDVDMVFMQNKNETTPIKSSKISNDVNNAPPVKRRKSPSPTLEEKNTNMNSHARRELFPTASSSGSPSKRQSMKLNEIYFYFFSSYPQVSHEAEADVVTLIRVVDACKRDFIPIVEKIKCKFSDILS